jgi:hypothetical protein
VTRPFRVGSLDTKRASPDVVFGEPIDGMRRPSENDTDAASVGATRSTRHGPPATGIEGPSGVVIDIRTDPVNAGGSVRTTSRGEPARGTNASAVIGDAGVPP